VLIEPPDNRHIVWLNQGLTISAS